MIFVKFSPGSTGLWIEFGFSNFAGVAKLLVDLVVGVDCKENRERQILNHISQGPLGVLRKSDWGRPRRATGGAAFNFLDPIFFAGLRFNRLNGVAVYVFPAVSGVRLRHPS